MTPENPQFIKHKKVLKGAIAGTALSVAAMSTGLYSWARQNQNPVNEACVSANSTYNALKSELIDDGSLDTKGSSFKQLEIRNPNDPRIREWVELENKRDELCEEADDYNSQRKNQLTRYLAPLGLTFTAIGTTIISYQRKKTSNNLTQQRNSF